MKKDLCVGFMVGALAGGIAALLYAPRSGKETRRMISDKVNEGKDKLMDAVDHLKDQYEHKKHEIMDMIEDARERYYDAKEGIAEDIQDAINCAQQEYEEVGKKLEKALKKK